MKLESYKEFSELIKRHFGLGVRTNFFLPPEYSEEIAADGRLSCTENPSSLLLYVKRDGFYSLYYYLTSDSPEIEVESKDLPIILEIPMKEGDEKAKSDISLFSSVGFREEFQRIRLTKTVGDEDKTASLPEYATEKDFPEIYEILYSSFERETGCLPNENEMYGLISDKKILVTRENGETAAVLHLEPSRGYTELRHLAVCEKYRRRGHGDKIIKDFLSAVEKKIRVWVREDNLGARKLYEKNGFKRDGMISLVLKKDK